MDKPRYNRVESEGLHAVSGVLLYEFDWIGRAITEFDMGIDIHAEISNNGNPSGRLLGIQVKSGPSYFKRIKNNSVAFSFSKVHYKYWMNYSLPVIVVLYRPADKRLIWGHVCEANLRKMKDQWQIQIPLTQTFSREFKGDLEKLAQIPSIAQVVSAKLEMLKGIDKRIKVGLVVTEGHEHLTLEAAETFPVSIGILGGKKVHTKLTNSFEKGLPIVLPSRDITITGSPLFDHLLVGISGDFTFKPVPRNLDLSISTIGSDDVRTIWVPFVPGRLYSGSKEFRIEGSLEKSPLSFELSGTRSATKRGKGRIRLDFSQWTGARILELPHFDKLRGLLQDMSEGAIVDILAESEGNNVFSCRSAKLSGPLPVWLEVIKFFNVARAVARFLNVNPAVPVITKSMVATTIELHELLENREIQKECPSQILEVPCGSINRDDPSYALLKECKPIQVAFDIQEGHWEEFLGIKVDLAPIVVAFTSVRLSNYDEVFPEKLDTSADGVVLRLETTDDCKIIRKLYPTVGAGENTQPENEVTPIFRQVPVQIKI